MVMVNVYDAKTHLSRLLERVAAGEEVVIARAGKPVAKLVPLPRQGERKLGVRAREIAPPDDAFFFAPMSEEDLRLWEGGGAAGR